MSSTITGRLAAVGQTVQIPSRSGGEPFAKREFLLDATTYDPYTGERSERENIVPLEMTGDKCAELDSFRTGDVITVSFALQGRSWTAQDGSLKRMASVRCFRIEARKPALQQQTVQPVQQQAPQPEPQKEADDLPF